MKGKIVSTSKTSDYQIEDCIAYERVPTRLRSAALSLYGDQAGPSPNPILKGSVVMLVGAAVLKAIAAHAKFSELTDAEVVQDNQPPLRPAAR